MPQPESQDRVIVQPILRPAAQAKVRTDSPSGGSRLRSTLTVLGLLTLAAVLIGVFVFLPRLVKTPQAPAHHTETQTAVPKADEPARPLDYQQLAVEMDKAEQARGTYESMLSSYEKRNAAQWAGDAFSSARAKGVEAAKQFQMREYIASQKSYEEGLADLQRVSDTANELLKQQLVNGAQAIEQGRSLDARKAFEFAQVIDPNNAVAEKGLKRAGTLDQVLALMTAAANAERAADMGTATKNYQEVVKLDPEVTAASEGIARAQGRISADNFSQAMSQGMSALTAGQTQQARAAFERASRIRPGATEVTDGLNRVAQLELQRNILGHRQRAEAFEREEKWEAARGEYEASLKLDGSLEFANQGQARTQPRAALNKQFEALIGKPDRLLSADVRKQAHAMLVEAAKVNPPGPVLSKQIQQLTAELSRSETPVQVALKSDNQTVVAINRVTQLGTFAQHQLQLLPGKYVAVGTRLGYRDVRKEFTVLPGEPAAVTVQCEDKI